MADERIDVEVTDKVDAGVAKKLNQIADAAERGENHLGRLKAALANVNSTALDRLAAAMAKADGAQAKLISAQARLTNAQNAGSVAASKVALANQKIATEAARTEAAQARAAAATTAAESAAMRLSAAQSRVAGASTAAAGAVNASATAATHAGAAYTGAAGGANAFAGATGAAANGANRMGGAANGMAAGLNKTANAANQHARAVRTANFANANIIAQMQDIGVSLAGGQNPLLVLIQQGSQLSYIASTLNGGWTQLLGTIGRLLLGLAPLIGVVTLLAAAFMGLKNAAASDEEMKKFANTLGLTRKEMKQLDDVTVTWGDTFKATMSVMAEAAGTSTEQISSAWSSMWSSIGEFAKFTIAILLAGFAALVKGAASAIINIGKAIVMFFQGAANLAIAAFEKMVNFAIKGANKVAGAINTVFGTEIKPLENVKFDKIDLKFDFSNPLKDMKDQLFTTYKGIQEGFDKISALATKNAKDRLRKQADEIIKDRTPKKPKEDHTAERRAHAIAMVNLKLDDELARMKLLKDERAVQQRMDQIEESLAQKKIKLNEQERASIEGKVRAIEAYKYVQAELDRIYEAAIGPARTYAASVQAINELLAQNAISAQRASQENVLASRALAAANDPLFQLKENMVAAEKASTLYGQAVERNNYYEQIRLAYLAQGVILGQNSTAAINAEVAALVARNNALLQQQFIQSQLSAIVNPILGENQEIAAQQAVYAELDRLRQADIIREGDYQRAKAALFVKYNEYKLNSAASFFGELASITKHGTGVVGAISKAAAVAEAVIQGYLAVQKALASGPPPWNFIAAAAVAIRTGANVAGILSTNVGSYATGGQFMVEGKSGVDTNNINMNVTRGERVTVETPAQQRAADSAGSAPIVDARTKVVTYFDEQSFLGAIDSDEGERIVMNIVRRNSGGGKDLS